MHYYVACEHVNPCKFLVEYFAQSYRNCRPTVYVIMALYRGRIQIQIGVRRHWFLVSTSLQPLTQSNMRPYYERLPTEIGVTGLQERHRCLIFMGQ